MLELKRIAGGLSTINRKTGFGFNHSFIIYSILKHHEMKSTDILSVLKLTRNKHTTAFCSVLASIFAFIKMIAKEITWKELSEPTYTLDQYGKVLTMGQIEMEYRAAMVSHYRYNDKFVTGLSKGQTSLRCELNQVRDILWKKRKNKNNSALEAERDALIVAANNLEQTITLLVDIEEMRLSKLSFTIEDMRKELNLFAGQKISLKTATGSYSFYVPVNNEYYRQLSLMLGIDTIKELIEIKPLKTILVDAEIFRSFGKAAKFTSNDDLRPAMTHVCLSIDNCKAEVVATDAHKLYRSASFDTSENGKLEILISRQDAISLSKMIPPETVEMHILAENKISIEGEIFSTLDARFPDYKCVIPTYSQFMEFNRKDMIGAVKNTIPYTNQSTSQVNFYLNGNIQLSGQDVDFGFEGGTSIAYKSKSFEDTLIAFNGKFMNECLGIFKDDYVKMYSEGVPTKAAIFTNDIDTVLLMPIMINSRY